MLVKSGLAEYRSQAHSQLVLSLAVQCSCTAAAAFGYGSCPKLADLTVKLAGAAGKESFLRTEYAEEESD